ncbi:MAG: tetratricopeptide repeat protein [Georgfuchsia sp.]
MDALKKAELAKRKSEAETASPAVEFPAPTELAGNTASESIDFESALPVVPPPEVPPEEKPLQTGAKASSLMESLELLDGDFSAMPEEGSKQQNDPLSNLAATPVTDQFSMQEIGIVHERRKHNRQIRRPPAESAPTKSVTDDTLTQEAIQNLFETKQPPASRNTVAIVGGIAAILLMACAGGYFWYELQPKSGLLANASLNINRPPPAPSIPIAATPAPAASEPVIPGLETPSESPDNSRINTVEAKLESPQLEAPAKKLFQTKKAATPQIDPALENGYSALKRGDMIAAKTAYQQALGNDPRNIDALSGLAAIAQHAGKPDQAAEYYLRLLEADPHNAYALAGLIDLRTQMNPAEAEMRLRQALSTQPDSAPLNFGLGNLYAAAKRWPEAQQAYFKAMAADQGNPDYLFNLAISLDQLRQPKLASNYYAQAIAAAKNRPGSFDQSRASERLQQLQP